MPTGESRDANYREARQVGQFQPTSPVTADALESIGGALETAKEYHPKVTTNKLIDLYKRLIYEFY